MLVGAAFAAGAPIFAWQEERTLLIALTLLAVVAFGDTFFAVRRRLSRL